MNKRISQLFDSSDFDIVAAAASKDLAAGGGDMHNLNACFSYAAGEALRSVFDDAISVSDFNNADEEPFYESASLNGYWRVRIASILEFDPAPMDRYSRLLNDAEPVVAYSAARLLLDLPPSDAIQLYESAPPTQSFILRSLEDYADARPTQRHLELANNLINRLPVSQRHTQIDDPLGVNTIASPEARDAIFTLHSQRRILSLGDIAELALGGGDPSVKLTAIEALNRPFDDPGQRYFYEVLRRLIENGNIAEQLVVAQKLLYTANKTAYDILGDAHLALTEHSCTRIVQTATRGLREYLDSRQPPNLVKKRLFELLGHPDALVRFNSLHSLQDNLRPTAADCVLLLDFWRGEPEVRIKIAAVETLSWWLPEQEWNREFAKWLSEIDQNYWAYPISKLLRKNTKLSQINVRGTYPKW